MRIAAGLHDLSAALTASAPSGPRLPQDFSGTAIGGSDTTMIVDVEHNPTEHRYEVFADGQLAGIVTYRDGTTNALRPHRR